MAGIVHIVASATSAVFPRRHARKVLVCCVAGVWRSVGAVQMSQPHVVETTLHPVQTDFDGANYVSLWDGGDVLAAAANDTMQLAAKPSKESCDSIAQPLGLYNTGTNLLGRLLYLNLPNRFFVPTDDDPAGIWKHSNLRYSWEAEDAAKRIRAVKLEHNYIAIAMIRNPFAWMDSMLKAPYGLHYCLQGGYEVPFKLRRDWLTHECFVPCPTTAGGELVPASNGEKQHCEPRHPRTLSSIVEVWNEWNRAYMSATEYGFDRIMVVRYEDLVMKPTEVLHQIAKYMKVEMPAVPQMAEEAAKTHGHPVDRDTALNKIRNKEYMGSFAAEDVAWVCSRLDKRLLEWYGYDSSCDGF
eukprot:TRINITY_DN293_c0_g1_i1.p1 TRINITY_DN293_c0_g1~~TRINITY_DN293_c0_g1_i1.p1  ORF type:complete len:355 (+),score=41.57 TRINITY_DN293_c0_g1_i1:41-1105(+)